MNIWTFVLCLSILVTSALLPSTTDAGVFSFITDLFTSKVSQADDEMPNSQTMTLLQAQISPNQQASTSKGEISIVGGTSLLAETQNTSSKDLFTASDQISLYVVHKGDTLQDIAKMYGVTKNTIVWANDLQGKTISVGQTLVILPISGVKHTVKKGDTLQSITKQYKGDLDEILQFNNLTLSSKLAIGDEIVIPDGEVGVTSSGGAGRAPSYPVYEGYYMRPIIGGIKTQGIHGHNGVDLASSYGSNIFASAPGDVIISRNSGWNGGYGSYVVISHPNGTQTLYGHLSGTSVSVGDHVDQGQIIGRMGHSGKVNGATGTHLHFEIRGARNPF